MVWNSMSTVKLLRTSSLTPQASESRLYTFSGETKEHLRKFRLGTSRAKDPQAVICAFHDRGYE